MGSGYNSIIQTSFQKHNTVAVKGIACIMIILGHLTSPSLPLLIRSFAPGYIWVGVFFIYSGFSLIVQHDRELFSWSRFWKKKMGHIILPFFIADSLYAVLISGVRDFRSLATKWLSLDSFNVTLWYVIELVLLWLMASSILCFPKRIQITAFVFAYFLFICAAVLFDIGTWWYESTSCFFIGIILARQEGHAFFKTRSEKELRGFLLTILLFGLAVYILVVMIMNDVLALRIKISLNYLLTGLQMIVVPLVSIGITGLVCWQSPPTALHWIGERSYDIYIVHNLVIALTERYLYDKDTIYGVFTIVCSSILIGAAFYFIRKAVGMKISQLKQGAGE